MADRGKARAVLALVVTGLAGAAVLTWTWERTSATIGANERNFQLRGLNQIVAKDRYDNDLFADTIEVSNRDLLGSSEPLTVYRARRDGQPVAVIVTAVAPEGYSGSITLLIGINYDGSIAGVRVSQHRETAGLGDQIEIDESNWILMFDGRALGDPPQDLWGVKKDGGQFDQLTGATITPRAIVRAVRDALLYYDANRDALFAVQSISEQ